MGWASLRQFVCHWHWLAKIDGLAKGLWASQRFMGLPKVYGLAKGYGFTKGDGLAKAYSIATLANR